MIIVRRLLLLVLSLCILGYGSAWAFDGHVIKADSNELPSLLQQADTHHAAHTKDSEKNSAEKSCCDHCCHISAHLQAIFNQNAYLTDNDSSSERLDYSEDFISCIVSPDLRPPRA
ncbi:MAG TPA: hypothetical protein ENJ11_00075 [Gammaproteobacteria bacterium]|nr:hypothetical protein [Gammaproteobacteria bacterium]